MWLVGLGVEVQEHGDSGVDDINSRNITIRGDLLHKEPGLLLKRVPDPLATTRHLVIRTRQKAIPVCKQGWSQ